MNLLSSGRLKTADDNFVVTGLTATVSFTFAYFWHFNEEKSEVLGTLKLYVKKLCWKTELNTKG